MVDSKDEDFVLFFACWVARLCAVSDGTRGRLLEAGLVTAGFSSLALVSEKFETHLTSFVVLLGSLT